MKAAKGCKLDKLEAQVFCREEGRLQNWEGKISHGMCVKLNPFQPSVAVHIETRYLFCCAKQVTGFYIKCNIRLKWVKVDKRSKEYGKFEMNFEKKDSKFCSCST